MSKSSLILQFDSTAFVTYTTYSIPMKWNKIFAYISAYLRIRSKDLAGYVALFLDNML